MGKYFCLLISISLFSEISTAARVDIDDQFSKQRHIYVKAENALKRRHITNYHRYLKKIPDYPLVPYLLYRDFRYRLSKATNEKVRSFLERYPNTPKSDKLRIRWLKSLWKKKDYPVFLSFYKPGLSSKLQCYQLQIRIKNNTIDQAAIDEINDLWLYHKSRPKACDPVFAYWAENGHRTDDLVWQRTALAMTKGVPSMVRYLKDLLPTDERYLADLWFELRTHPTRVVNSAKKAQRSPKESVVFAYAIRRFTWRKSQKALAAWQKIKNLREFSESEKTAVWKALTLKLADKVGQPKLNWLNNLPESELTGELRVLRIRHALAALKWRQAQVWLDKLPQQEAQLSEWKYWQARSLAQLGKHSEALEIYKKLAGLRDFYGFLAAAQLGEAGQIQHQPLKLDNTILIKARQLPMMQRAKELYLLKRLVQARREWHQLTHTVKDKPLLAAAAQVASNWGWHYQAIIALAKARMYDDISIRYPLAHKKTMTKYSQQMNIPVAWPFAIARQESAFSIDIRSEAGALGLMQLLPSTAKSVARKLKTKSPSSYQLIQPATNIRFGTAYLKQLLNAFNGNLVLAIASYNAGPTRVRRWVPKHAVPEDVWVELIPYRETARYVKNVLSNQFIYNRQLGQTDGVFAQMSNQSIGKAKGVVKKHTILPSQVL